MVTTYICSFLQTSNSVFFHAEVGVAWHPQVSVCAGFGASVCKHIAEAEGSLAGGVATTKTGSKYDEHTDAAVLSLSYDYSTSDDSSLAGNKSDMFLTPALNVKFSKSALIAFNASTCGATSQDVVTWSLDSDSNVPVSCHYSLLFLF
jgi:hypothetical protein